MNCRALVVTAAGLCFASPADLAGASAPAVRAVGSPANPLSSRAAAIDDGPLRATAVFSGPDENDDSEPDTIFVKPAARFPRRGATGSAASGATSLGNLPSANDCVKDVLEKIRGREVKVALLGSHKYMLADCLGIKVSAGQFKLRLDNPNLSFAGGKVIFECGIDHVSFSAFKLRVKPNVANPLDLCKFSRRHTVGGKADDVRLKLVFDPIVTEDHCQLSSLGSVDVTVRIGDLNMSGVQNDLDRASKNMIEDALSVFLDYEFAPDLGTLIDHFLQAGCGITDGGDHVTKNSGRGENAGDTGSSPGDAEMQRRFAELEARVAAIEQRLGDSTVGSSAGAPAKSTTTGAAQTTAPGTTEPIGVTPRGAETIGPARPQGPQPTARIEPGAARSGGAFQIVANPELKGRLGRIVVAFPKGTKDLKARTEIFRPGDASGLRTHYGDFAVEMTPGTYDLNIGGHVVAGIVVESRNDTRVPVGVLRLNASGNTRFEIFEPGQQKSLGTYYGQNEVGLPPGRYDIDVSGQREVVTITAGTVSNY